jgi:hypothetical protein
VNKDERINDLESLVHHLRHCRECGEMDVSCCSEGRPLWEKAMPQYGLEPAPTVGAKS